MGYSRNRLVRNHKGEDDIDIYSEEVRESMLEDDELISWENGFMSGYENAV